MPDILELLPKDSFLRDWPSCWPDLPAPNSFLVLTGISALGAALGRKAFLPYGHWTTIPIIPVIVLGPPGLGKTESIKCAEVLIESLLPLDQPTSIPPSTKEELLWCLSFSPHAIMYATEMAAFFSTEKYKEGVVPAITALLDFPRTYRTATRKDGVITIKEPALTIMAASTIPWFQERLPKSANEGGFLARYLIVHETEPGKHVAFAGDRSPKEEYALSRKREQVLSKFKDAASLQGQFRMDSWGAKDVFVPWKTIYKPPAEVADTFASRKDEFVLRLAINLAASCGKMIIDEDHMRAAVGIYEYCMHSLAKVIVPFTIIGKAQAQILHIAGESGATDKEICRALANSYPAQDVLKWINSLEFSEKLVKKEGRYFEARV